MHPPSAEANSLVGPLIIHAPLIKTEVISILKTSS